MTCHRADAVLFDLDGTVLDTAPDLLWVLDHMRARRGLGGLPMAQFRAWVSRGSRAMLGAGLPGFSQADAQVQTMLVSEFLDIYQQRIYGDSVLFPGMESTLDALADRGIALAIVTNKPHALACALLAAMGLAQRFPVLLGGDSLIERKPHPLPVLTACERLGVAPGRAWMVGDDRRDIQAGRAAGCSTVAVAWGYAATDEWSAWNADHVIDAPDQLLALIAA